MIGRALVAAVAWLAAVPAFAHGAASAGEAIPLGIEPVAATLLLAASLGYAFAARRFAGVRSPRHRRGFGASVAFHSGCFVFFVALASPLEALAGALLSAHMVQHLLLVTAAPLLVVAGRPDVILPFAFGARARPALAAFGRHFVRPLLRRPVLAAFVHGVAVWAWHAPPLFEAAVVDWRLHAAEHLSFALTALWFWAALLASAQSASRRLAAALAALVTLIHGGILGAMLAFAPRLLYPVYEDDASALGLEALADQQLAGLIMWVPGGIAYLGAGMWVAARLLSMARPRPA